MKLESVAWAAVLLVLYGAVLCGLCCVIFYKPQTELFIVMPGSTQAASLTGVQNLPHFWWSFTYE